MRGYVYILIEKNGKTFKIGKALNFYKRNRNLNYNFNYEKSYLFEYDICDYASVEIILKHNFKGCSRKKRIKKNGSTEFFRIDCLDEVLSFLEVIRMKGKKVRINKEKIITRSNYKIDPEEYI